MEIVFDDGTSYIEELALAHAHPFGKKPFQREDYIRKFDSLTSHIIDKKERDRFLNLVTNLEHLTGQEVLNLNVCVPLDKITHNRRDERGIF